MNESPRPGIIQRAVLRAMGIASAAAGAIGGWRGVTPWSEGMQRIHLRAQKEAARLGTSAVGPEQYLLALLADSDCAGARVLEQLGISLCLVRQQLLQQVLTGPGPQGR